ncbi:MAG: hypothetical protein ACK56I_24740, partial [bacterium]
MEFRSFEEVDPGIFHVRDDKTAEPDTIPRRVNGAAHVEGQAERLGRALTQAFLHGRRLQMEVEGEDRGGCEHNKDRKKNQAGSKA